MKDEILYQIVAVDSDLIKGCPDKVTFISQREDMSDGIIYNDYDFKNHRYIKAYVSDNFNIYDRLEEKDKQLDKYKNVIDKIKEYCNKQIEIAKENITNSEQWLKVEECHLFAKQDIHTGKLIKRENEKILELLEKTE